MWGNLFRENRTSFYQVWENRSSLTEFPHHVRRDLFGKKKTFLSPGVRGPFILAEFNYKTLQCITIIKSHLLYYNTPQTHKYEVVIFVSKHIIRIMFFFFIDFINVYSKSATSHQLHQQRICITSKKSRHSPREMLRLDMQALYKNVRKHHNTAHTDLVKEEISRYTSTV